jgi:GAF domain-containing protein
MALPLRVGNRVIGALDIQSTRAQAFDKDDITALQGMADQIAVALENARLFQQSQSSLQEIERVNRLLTQQGWETFLRSARTDFAEFHQPGVASLTPQEVEKLTQKQRSLADQDGVASIPLRVRGQVIGTLVVERAADRTEWSATELGLLEEMAAQSAQALESARLFEEPQRRAAREQLTRQITDNIRAATSVEDAMQRAVGELARALGATEIVGRIGTEQDLLAERGVSGHGDSHAPGGKA